MFNGMGLDLRISLRQLQRQWAFTLAAVVTIALGAGANATVFSLVNAIVLRPLPIGDPQHTVNIYGTNGPRDRFNNFSVTEFHALRDGTRTLTELAAFDEVSAILQDENSAERIVGQIVSVNFFAALALQPHAGLFFTRADEATGAVPSVVISHALWQRRYRDRTTGPEIEGAAPGSVIGRAVLLNGHAFTIAGVAPEHFRGTFRGADYTFWVPLRAHALLQRNPPQMSAPGAASADVRWLNLVARRAPGTSIEQVRAEVTTLRRALNQQLGLGESDPRADVFPSTGLPDSRRSAIQAFMGVLTAISALVLLIACVNLAGMLAGRGLARSKEIALRVALGASRARLLSQLLLETTLLLALGAIAGALLATWTASSLLTFLPSTDVPIVLDLSVDGRVLTFTLGTTLIVGLVLGFLPLLQVTRPDLIQALRTSAVTVTGKRMRLRRLLVRAQIATSLVLVIVSGLFARAVLRAQHIDPGFQTEGVVAAAIDVGPNASTAAQGLQLYQRIEESLRRRADVEQVSFANAVPLTQFQRGGAIRIAGQESAPGNPAIAVSLNAVAPRYFALMRIPLLRGRDFGAGDRAGAESVAIISRTLAERHWPGSDAVGRVFTDAQSGMPVTVIGVVADTRYRSLAEPPRPLVYYPLAQQYDPSVFLHVRTGNPDRVLRELPALVRAIDPVAAVFNAAPLERHVSFALVPQKVAAAVAAVLSALGLLLTAIGLYAVVSLWVGQRRHELAIRTALGAAPLALLHMIAREGTRLIAGGAVAGLVAAVALTQLLTTFLFGVSPVDPIVLGGAVLVLGLLLLLACVEPAHRVLRMEPMRILRDS